MNKGPTVTDNELFSILRFASCLPAQRDERIRIVWGVDFCDIYHESFHNTGNPAGKGPATIEHKYCNGETFGEALAGLCREARTEYALFEKVKKLFQGKRGFIIFLPTNEGISILHKGGEMKLPRIVQEIDVLVEDL